MTKTALITGSNRGIGLELVKQLNTKGYEITCLCRSKNPQLNELASQVISGINLQNYQDIQRAKINCKAKYFDIIINNAAIFKNESIQQLDSTAVSQIKDQFITNSLAPLMVIHHFLDTLKKGSKIVLMTSRMGSIADNSSGGRYGYRMSKAALNAAGKSLALDLKDKGVAVGIFHPGWVQTDMTGYSGYLTASESAELLCQRIDALSMNNSGEFFHSNGDSLPW